MKELQAANENKQQELETVRKVGVGAWLGAALISLQEPQLPYFGVLVLPRPGYCNFRGIVLGELCSQEVYLDH